MKGLYESLLGDDIFNNIEDVVSKDWMQQHCTGSYKSQTLKNGKVKIRGTLVIKDADYIPSLNITSLDGKLYIEHCKVGNLDGLFDRFGDFKCDIYISDCPNLTNISGLPVAMHGEVSISDCKSLTNLDGTDCMCDRVTIMKCGKRFNKTTVKKHFPLCQPDHGIFCSEEECDAMICESFHDPILMRLWDQLKNDKMQVKLGQIFGVRLSIDKISPSCRTTFKFPEQEKAMKSAVRSIMIRYGEDGLVVTEDWDGRFRHIYSSWHHGGKQYSLSPKDRFKGEKGYVFGERDVAAAVSSGSTIMQDVKYVHVWKFDDDLSNRKLQQARAEAKHGVINYDKESLENMLFAQRSRYKDAVKKIKAIRGSAEYKAMGEKVNKIMERFSKLVTKMIAEPTWAKNNRFDIDRVIESIREGWAPGRKYQQYGVIYLFQLYAAQVINVSNGDGGNMPDPTELDKAIEKADRQLSKIGL